MICDKTMPAWIASGTKKLLFYQDERTWNRSTEGGTLRQNAARSSDGGSDEFQRRRPAPSVRCRCRTTDGRLAAMEKAIEVALRRSADKSAPRAGEKSMESEADVVCRCGFALLKWMGAFASTAMAGGFLYLRTAHPRLGGEQVLAETERQHAVLRRKMQEEHGTIRSEMREGQSSIRVVVGDIRERTLRIEALMPRRSGRSEGR